MNNEAKILSAKMLRSLVPETPDRIKIFREESHLVSKLFCDFAIKAKSKKIPAADIERIKNKIDDLHKEFDRYEEEIKIKR